MFKTWFSENHFFLGGGGGGRGKISSSEILHFKTVLSEVSQSQSVYRISEKLLDY